MANLKAIRKRISSVKSTQKITRAQKMVAGARLTRAQQRIQALRPYAVKTAQVLAEVAGGGGEEEGAISDSGHTFRPGMVRLQCAGDFNFFDKVRRENIQWHIPVFIIRTGYLNPIY